MATTAIEMLALNPCRKMMVFGMDLGIESDTETDIIKTIDNDSNKRLSLELDDDQDKGPVKKRRKQSKPVRIASSESLSDGENFPENLRSDKDKEDGKYNGEVNTSFDAEVSENIEKNLTTNEKYDLKTTNGDRDDSQVISNQNESFRKDDSSLLPINLSSTKSTTNFLDSFVRTQVPENNQNQNIMKQVTQDIRTSPYQETGFEGMPYKKENVFISTSSSPLSFPSMKPIHLPNSAPHTSSPLRIFNPEAFCDLCNKEFCNKYFLKTHKANKHGIYIDNIGPNVIDALPSLPFINYFSNVNEMLPSNPQVSRTTVRKPQLSVSLPQQNANFSLKNSPINGNTRAFCNICQREFCNKYFVRRHKAKIHGIMDVSYPDTPPSDTQEQKSQNANDVRMNNSNHDKYDDTEIHSALSQSQIVSNFPTNMVNDKESKENYCPLISKEEMCNSEQQPHSVRLDRDMDSDESTGAGTVGIYTNACSQNSSFGNPQCQNDDTGKDNDLADDKTKRSGIINSEAFCDICCKEYCNKYFLRTHKLKSHGIVTPDCDKRDDRINSCENSSNYNSQMMPLNLIVGDHNPEKTDKIVSEYENGDTFCTLCGQKFKNIFLLKMHTSYMHPQDSLEKNIVKENNLQLNDEKPLKQIQIFKNDSGIILENSQKSIADEEKCFNFDFPNINSLMLKCEICRKSFDSASLEIHIETEHANLLEEIGAIEEEDNSDSQLSVQGLKLHCSSCQKVFQNSGQLEQHIIERHTSNADQLQINQGNNLSIKMLKDNDELLKNNQIPNMYSVAEIQTTPTSSFCEICKKELCNKYFMKTHMQRMHGISIENGAHIGGVVCDICNKELCSKYFLRVHKQNSHGIVDEVLGLDMARNQSPNTDPSLRPTEQSDLNSRYFSHFTEVCSICSRRFRSVKWLKAHLLNDHGEEGKEKWKELQVTFEMRQLDKYPKDILKKSESSVLMGNSFVNTSANSNNNNNNINNNCTQKINNEGYQQRSDSASSQINGNSDGNVKSSVFTTIFNGKSTNSKQYQCSYCPFSTTILAFLFVHERSHMGSSNLLLEQNQKLQCKICSLTFDSYDNYEKHSLSHNVTGVSSFSGDDQSEVANKAPLSEFLKQKEVPENDKQVKKDFSYLSERFSPILKENTKSGNDVEIFEVNTCSGVVKGNQQKINSELRHDMSFNDYTSANAAAPEYIRRNTVYDERIKQEIEVDDEVNGALTQVKESLELIANRTEIPVSFSVPQSQKQVIMQPFVLEDSGELISSNNKKTGLKKSFLSSIVFLPVKERLKSPVMVSFKLTPT